MLQTKEGEEEKKKKGEKTGFAASSEEDAGKVNPTAWGRALAPKR